MIRFFKKLKSNPYLNWTIAILVIATVTLSILEQGHINKFCKEQGYQAGGWSLMEGRYCFTFEQKDNKKWTMQTYPYEVKK